MDGHVERLMSRKSILNRKQVVKAAVQYFTDNLPGRFPGRADAIREIKGASRPLTVAKRLIATHRVRGLADEESELDFSDVQEIRAQLIHRDHILDQPQATALARMDRMIAEGDMNITTFQRMASDIIGMKPALSLDVRKAEAAGVSA
ncbi:MAG: hypothetical protein GEU78_08080 [Actinobacteria bacterium]|nr:hypothetical protein [Actinomycetota bacterium]